MSGFEVVGLLLGVFPLVVSAIEHYRDVHKAAGYVLRFESEYRKALDDVKDEQLFFRLNLEELLLPLVKSETFEEVEVQDLLVNLSHPGWKTSDVVLGSAGQAGIDLFSIYRNCQRPP